MRVKFRSFSSASAHIVFLRPVCSRHLALLTRFSPTFRDMSSKNTNNLARKPLAPRETINLQGARKDILLSLAIIFVPNVILTAILLGLVFHYQVPQTYFELPGVPEPLARESSAYLINFSATKLLTVASWTSTLSSLLPSFVMVLVSYPIARTILDASKDKKTDDLPTPYQLSMLLGTLNGTFGSLWNWLMYRRRKKRELINGVAKNSITWLVIVSVIGLGECTKHVLPIA